MTNPNASPPPTELPPTELPPAELPPTDLPPTNVPPTNLKRLLRPRSVAVVGATEKPGYASRLFRNLVDGGFGGGLYPVSRTRDTVFGHRAYRSVADAPPPVDVAMVVVPADHVPRVVEECGEAGVAAAVVISAGFGEAGEPGRRRSALLRTAAAPSGVLVLGPNANGYASVPGGVWATTFSRLRPHTAAPPLPAVLLSQSGGAAFGAVHERAQDHGFSFEAVLSTGNEEVTTSERLARQLLTTGTRVVAMVCEDFRDGRELLRAAAVARSRGSHLVVLKVGRSEAGRAAAATHTAALASDDAVVDGVLRQHGVVRVDDVDELVQCVRFLATSRPPTGRSAVVLSHSGGLATLAADALGTAGFSLPPLPEPVRSRLDALLPDGVRGSNPVDVSMALREPVVSDVVRVLLQAAPDVLQVVTAGDTGLPDRVAAGRRAVGDDPPPVCLVWTSGIRTAEGMERLDGSEVPWFTGSRIAADVLSRCRDAAAAVPPVLSPVDTDSTLGILVDEGAGKALLRRAGITVPEGVLVPSAGDVVAAAAGVPAPWVLKVVSPQVLHKAAAGLVVTGLRDTASLAEAAVRLARSAASAVPDGAWRFLVERHHAVAAELYLGCTVDPHFGPVVGVGRGGAGVEDQPAVVWSTCPVDEAAARHLLTDQRVAGVLRGAGVTDRSRGRVAEAVAAVSRWFLTSPQRPAEVEVNPLAVDADTGDVLALDAVMRLREPLDPTDTEPEAT